MSAYILIVVSYVAQFTTFGPINQETGKSSIQTKNSYIVTMQEFRSKDTCEETKKMISEFVIKAECKRK